MHLVLLLLQLAPPYSLRYTRLPLLFRCSQQRSVRPARLATQRPADSTPSPPAARTGAPHRTAPHRTAPAGWLPLCRSGESRTPTFHERRAEETVPLGRSGIRGWLHPCPAPRRAAQGCMSKLRRAMKSSYFSCLLLLLTLALIVVIMIDKDSKMMIRAPGHNHNYHINHSRNQNQNLSALPVIYAITPTYKRLVQKAELTRLAHVFRQVPRLHWVLVEDSRTRTELVTHFLARCGVPYTHLQVLTPRRFHLDARMSRGTEQRNAALAWLRQHRSRRDAGVVFFADDDNTYSLELFQEMRNTRGVSIWPVGLVGGLQYERPLVSRGKVVGWHTGWRPDRPFAVDMAGFGVNLQVILAHPRAQFNRRVGGMQEPDFLKQITKVTDLEPKANNCTRVLVWHTRTQAPYLNEDSKQRKDTMVIEV
ncbi:galactosylgalactosylxylosylprotein 3-beta-glucuronosyltransferase 2 [Nelusetta ayraudi]|uniref:galactosylgalactosylxylosylprotein 3-beta-glucuronosyltransferase 2 n=1 Tax=Nelusetta ayraudi TaxID=303726 RepID=UPI003F710E30